MTCRQLIPGRRDDICHFEAEAGKFVLCAIRAWLDDPDTEMRGRQCIMW